MRDFRNYVYYRFQIFRFFRSPLCDSCRRICSSCERIKGSGFSFRLRVEGSGIGCRAQGSELAPDATDCSCPPTYGQLFGAFSELASLSLPLSLSLSLSLLLALSPSLPGHALPPRAPSHGHVWRRVYDEHGHVRKFVLGTTYVHSWKRVNRPWLKAGSLKSSR